MTHVQPGSGWPDDPAAPTTPIAHSAQDVVRLAGNAPTLDHIDARVSVCRACPRLVEWRERVAVEKRAAFRDEPYWGRPVPGWGDPNGRILVLGLAPAAHGGNRTGRIFTGDRSGDWLFAALHRAGFARLTTSHRAGDGQRLTDVRIEAAVRCAPPGNAPTPQERDTCRPWLARELEFAGPRLRVIVVLGGFAWAALWPALLAAGHQVPARKARFGHLSEVELPPSPGRPGVLVLGCYHPSQQNTFTGKLTEAMLDEVFARAAAAAAAQY